MVTSTDFLAKLDRISNEIDILTDVEDRYVYSFERIFTEQAYPMPDIVIRVVSPEVKIKVLDCAKKADVQIIERGVQFSAINIDLKKPIVIIDDSKIPGRKTISRKNKDHIIENMIQTIHRNVHAIPMNAALATQTSFLTNTLSDCLKKNICSGYCTITPSFNGIETWSSKGRMLLIKGLKTGELSLSDKIIDVIYTCSKCGHCFAECFEDLDFHKAITEMRNQIAEKGLIPEAFQIASRNISTFGDPGGNSKEKRVLWIKKPHQKFGKKADILFWVGCMVATRNPDTAKAFYNILNSVQDDFTMLGTDEGCCGYVLLSSGLWDEAKKVAVAFMKKVQTTNAKTLITPCAGCYYTFTKLYPEILDISLPFDVLHSTQYIENMIVKGELILNPLKKTVTYHDPCSLGKHSFVYDTPRNVLKLIPDLKFVESSLSQNQSRCCGGGGGLWTHNYQVSMESAYSRLNNDIVPLGVDILTTACPQCHMNFRLTARRKRIPLQINDITELVESAIDQT
jgi:Fe-S oxidoreductase